MRETDETRTNERGRELTLDMRNDFFSMAVVTEFQRDEEGALDRDLPSKEDARDQRASTAKTTRVDCDTHSHSNDLFERKNDVPIVLPSTDLEYSSSNL